jgi:hypothetical protein
MAERIVSPGVFTNEVDQSFLAGGVAQIGAAIVGPTVKGPALVPTQITSFGDYERVFGSFTDDSYVPFVVNDYLRNGNVITVTRLLYEDGYNLQNGALAVIATSASVSVVTHVLHPTQPVLGAGSVVNAAYFEDSVIGNDASGSFEIKISGSYVAASNTAIGFDGSFLVAEGASISSSITQTDNNYITKIFGKSPKSIDYPVYVQYENKTATSLFENLGDVTITLGSASNYQFLQDYQTAATPWITSQTVSGQTVNLIKFHTLSHGTSVNEEIKVAIRDIRLASEVSDPNDYGTFTVELRRVNTRNIVNSPYSSEDTDRVPDTVEVYEAVNLDPNSPKYISRVIGDRYQTVSDEGVIRVNGDYPNISQFVRVEVTSGVTNATNDKSLIPFGSRALTSPVPNFNGTAQISAAAYKTLQTDKGGYSSKLYYGFDFDNERNLNYLAPTPTSGSTTGSNADFYLGNVLQATGSNFPTAASPYTGSLQSALTAGTFTNNIKLDTRKFIVPTQGGFDGARPNLPKYNGTHIANNNTFGFDCSTSTATGTKSYNKAFTILGNTDYYDMNLLVTPGIIDSLHSSVTNAARNLVQDRQDTFYVMDSNALTDSINTVTAQVNSIDNNYTATYWPWVRITNPSNNVPLWVPPSVVLPGVLAFNDAVQHPWYAPAGLNRGVLRASDTYLRLTQSNRDTLYEARVNPIANFVNDGVCIWGQKTLQARPSALDRVNVRRLLIAVKKFIASSTRYLVFEQNTNQTRDKFLSIVNPYLADVKANQGLYAFRAIMDDSNNTSDLIDQNILYGQLFLQPTRTAEFIVLDFNIQPTGASFPE